MYNKNMDQLRFKPRGLWKLDSLPPEDISGLGSDGTVTGSPTPAIGLAPDSFVSHIFDDTNYVELPSPIFKQGHEYRGFTLEAVFAVIPGSDGEVKVFSHSGDYDGILVNGSEVSFVTKYENTGECRASYDLLIPQRIHVLGVHTANKNSLFINGELVAEASVTDEQAEDVYSVDEDSLVIGQTSTTQKIMVNNTALYAYPLGGTEADTLWAELRQTEGLEPATMRDGTIVDLSINNVAASITGTWDDEDTFEDGHMVRCRVNYSRLVPLEDENGALPGVWSTGLDLDPDGEGVPLHTANIIWHGRGIVVSTSMDGVNWSTATNGRSLSTVPLGVDASYMQLFIRVDFIEGYEDAFIDDLNVYITTEDDVDEYSGMPVFVSEDAGFMLDMHPFRLYDLSGVNLSGGTLTIGESTPPDEESLEDDETDVSVDDEIEEFETVELWVKLGSGSLSFSETVSTTFVNGGLTSNPMIGEWALHHVVLSAPTRVLEITGDAIISRAAVYPVTFTEDDSMLIYRNYTKRDKISYYEPGMVDFVEPSAPVAIYGHDWSKEVATG